MDQPSEPTKPKQTSAAQVENMSGNELQDDDNGQGETFQQSVMDEKQRLKYETEKEAELNDAFGYYDRKRQGKLQLTFLDDVVSMLGITLPPTEKRGPLIKLADPQGSGFFTAASLKNLVKQIKGVTTSEDDIVTTYRLFDRQNKGFFARDELKAVLKRYLGKPPTEDELEQIMSMGEPPKGSSSAEKVISKDTFVSLFK